MVSSLGEFLSSAIFLPEVPRSFIARKTHESPSIDFPIFLTILTVFTMLLNGAVYRNHFKLLHSAFITFVTLLVKSCICFDSHGESHTFARLNHTEHHQAVLQAIRDELCARVRRTPDFANRRAPIQSVHILSATLRRGPVVCRSRRRWVRSQHTHICGSLTRPFLLSVVLSTRCVILDWPV